MAFGHEIGLISSPVFYKHLQPFFLEIFANLFEIAPDDI
jgi:hypothetical protein